MLAGAPRVEAKSASLWIHGREVDEEELLLSVALLEELQLKPGDFLEIDFAETPEAPRSNSPARDKSPPRSPSPPPLSSGDQTLVLRVPEAHRPPSKSALQISVQRPVAEAFHLCNRQPVLLRQVRAEDVALDWVELVFKEQYMSRGDIWHFRRHLLERAPALYVGKVRRAVRRAATTYYPPSTARRPPPAAHGPPITAHFGRRTPCITPGVRGGGRPCAGASHGAPGRARRVGRAQCGHGAPLPLGALALTLTLSPRPPPRPRPRPSPSPNLNLALTLALTLALPTPTPTQVPLSLPLSRCPSAHPSPGALLPVALRLLRPPHPGEG
jgi:hypothetical protein